ncbi:major facilitator superfamily domain-containing protein [Dactylonectria estremocensis]|uniref:Major facilitator superfamily domain-containing protein n=1 Tax=Dactylonectria estremocensis TaxID=1079267 RepID=A0A9P9E0G0_9HYPO|nr:major facilitator superfamily domain-containing protein [Dactylonectria estremocensis]
MASPMDKRDVLASSHVEQSGNGETQPSAKYSLDGAPCVPVASVDKTGCTVEHDEMTKDPEAQGHGVIYPEHRAQYLTGWPLVWAFVGWLMTEFMGGLGGNMLSPALPVVASKFNGLNQLGWVSGAYYMSQCGCMLLFGQSLAVFNAKYVLIAAIVFFMIGSTISGGAQDITTLILGRAIAGIGAAGCWVSVLTLVALLVELKTRPVLMGLFGVQNAISGTVGPIIAGAFANIGLWRMCFLIVLPLGTITILIIWFVLPSVPALPIDQDLEAKLDRHLKLAFKSGSKNLSDTARRWILIDWIGYFTVTSSLVCFILALQWGGSAYEWKSATIIGLFLGFGGLMVLFVVIQHYTTCPIMPLRAWKNRTVVGASFMAMFTLMCNLFAAVFIPVLYEAGRGVTSLKAGLLVIPFLLTVVLSQAAEGLVMSFTKSYWHWGWTCPAFLAIGGGLLYTVDIDTSDAALIGYQIIYGLGIGFTQNVAFLSVQADNPESEVPAAIAIVSFTQLFGGMCGPVIGNAILQGGLKRYLPANGVDEETIKLVQGSVFAVWELSGELRTQVIKGYLRALNDIYIGAVPISGIIIACGLLIRNRSLSG